ncbi:calcium-binding protein [Pseudooceanicola sp. 502str34]
MSGSIKGWSFVYIASGPATGRHWAGPARLIFEGGTGAPELIIGDDTVTLAQAGAQITYSSIGVYDRPTATTSQDSLTLEGREADVIALRWGEAFSQLTYLLRHWTAPGESPYTGVAQNYFYLDGDLIEESDLADFPANEMQGLIDISQIVPTERFVPGTTIALESLAGYLDADLVPVATEGNDLAQFVPLMAPFDALGGDDTVIGSASDDSAAGGAGNDSLAGRDGNDTLSGGIGNDSLLGDTGNDSLSGGDGDDLLSGGAGSDVLTELRTPLGQILPASGNDTLLGGDGDDVISLGTGSDSVDGEAGNDTISVDFDGDGGTTDDHTLRGGDGDDQFLLYRGGGVAMGGAGNDHFTLDGGTYRIDGGEGMDTLRAAQADLSVSPLEGDVAIEGIEHLEGFRTVSNQLTGDANANAITGGNNSDTLIGNDGDDTLGGAGGRDSMLGGAGDDRMDGGISSDTLRGGDGADHLEGSYQADVLDGGAGNDTIYGGLATGVPHPDLSDTIYAGAGDDFIYAGYGNDLVYGGADHDTLDGHDGADTLIGEAGDDVISGGALGDVLVGGAGDDFLSGGFGHDRLHGGAGADRFFHAGEPGDGTDWVQDYDADADDTLVLAPTAVLSDYQVNFAETPGAGQADVAEAFVIYRPTGQVLWALVDGGAQDRIMLTIAGTEFDLLA